MDKKVRKELKQTLKHTKDLLSVDSSTLTGAHQDIDASESGADSIISSSMQSSQKPKGSKLNALGSHEKSNTNKERPSPSSSFAQVSKNSETQTSKATPEQHQKLPLNLLLIIKLLNMHLMRNCPKL